jgi:hypothetical protein
MVPSAFQLFIGTATGVWNEAFAAFVNVFASETRRICVPKVGSVITEPAAPRAGIAGFGLVAVSLIALYVVGAGVPANTAGAVANPKKSKERTNI